MKHLITKHPLAFIVPLALMMGGVLSSIDSHAGDPRGHAHHMKMGDKEGNGGDPLAQEFYMYGLQLLDQFRCIGPELKGLDAKLFEIALHSTVLSVSEELSKEYSENVSARRMAKNYPDDHLIEISSTYWKDVTSPADRRSIVLHEYLGILGLEVERYDLSRKILNQLDRDPKCGKRPVDFGSMDFDSAAAIFSSSSLPSNSDLMGAWDSLLVTVNSAQEEFALLDDPRAYLAPAHFIFSRSKEGILNASVYKNQESTQDHRGEGFPVLKNSKEIRYASTFLNTEQKIARVHQDSCRKLSDSILICKTLIRSFNEQDRSLRSENLVYQFLIRE